MHEEIPVTIQRGHKRADSIDALSFGTVLSSDDENDGHKFHNKRPTQEDHMQVVTIFYIIH